MSTLEDFISLVNQQANQLVQVTTKARELLAENERLKERIKALEHDDLPTYPTG